MTVHPIDTEALRARLARAIKSGIDAYPIEEWDPRDEWEVAADEVLLIVRDLLAAAEHRATRAGAQSAIRGRAVAVHQQRAREAEYMAGLWKETTRHQLGHIADRDDAHASCHWNSLVQADEVSAWQERAEQAEAQIKAVREALDGWDDIQPPAFHQLADEIRRALDGTDTPTDAG